MLLREISSINLMGRPIKVTLYDEEATLGPGSLAGTASKSDRFANVFDSERIRIDNRKHGFCSENDFSHCRFRLRKQSPRVTSDREARPVMGSHGVNCF